LWYLKNQSYYSKINKKDITKRIGIQKWLKKELFWPVVKGQEWVH
jgi:hypothetical protein